jgi:pimeloyl-ACP methyl ester carboxylesterase
VSAWWQPPPHWSAGASGAPVVLMLHGNGENLETMRRSGLFTDFARLGAGVLAIDYPGYGRSGGVPSEASNVAAAEAAWQWLGEHAPGPRVLAGWSLGAAVAAQVAARHREDTAALILMSGWDRLVEVASLHFPRWIVAAALPEHYDSAAAAAEVACPALVIHGEGDDLVPVARGRALFAALPQPKQWLEVRGAGHNDLLARPEVWQAIGDVLARVRLPGGGAAGAPASGGSL